MGAVESPTFHSFKAGSSETINSIPWNGCRRKISKIGKINLFLEGESIKKDEKILFFLPILLVILKIHNSINS